MAADRIITCTNSDGESITFSEDGLNDFILVKVDGVYDAQNTINITENTMTDGAVYHGSTAKYRNIVLTLKDISESRSGLVQNDDIYISSAVIHDKELEIIRAEQYENESRDIYISSAVIHNRQLNIIKAGQYQRRSGGEDFVAHRQELDKVFKRGSLGRLSFKEADEEKVIDYYVESMQSTGTHTTRLHTISLICPDPFFYDPNDNVVKIAQWVEDFEFIHEFDSEGEELGHFISSYEDIYNDSADENIGFTAVISGSNAITNPSLTRYESNESIKVGTQSNPFTLQIGDILTITTGTGNKHVYLTSGGVTTEINQYLSEDSTFIQIMRGHNNIGYDADLGKGGMEIMITYRLRHVRA